MIQFTLEVKENLTVEELDNALIKLRKAIVARETSSKPEADVLIFPQKEHGPVVDAGHFILRGIDLMRAGLEVIESSDNEDALSPSPSSAELNRSSDADSPIGGSQSPINANKQNKVKALIASFAKMLKDIQSVSPEAKETKKFKKYKKALKEHSHHVMSTLALTPEALDIVLNVRFKQAFGKQKFETEYPPENFYNQTYNQTVKRHFEPLFVEESSSDTNSGCLTAESLGIPQKLAEKHHWVQEFINRNKATLQSPHTPMNRYMAGLAGAYESTTIIGDNTVFSNTLVSITEPFDMKTQGYWETFGFLDDAKLEAITQSHRQLFLNADRLTSFAKNYMQRFYSGSTTITPIIPILHQTLIADGVPLVPDHRKTHLALDYKKAANDRVRETLKKEYYYWDQEAEKILNFQSEQNNPGLIRVQFELLETNNCINRHHKISTVRNQDIWHARRLVELARLQLQNSWGEEPSDEQKKILEFLHSSDYSVFTPYKSRGADVKNALNQLNGRDDREKNLKLLAMAAVELKCVVHETRLGALRRRMHRAIPGVPALKWFAIALSFVLANTFKLLVAPILLYHWFKHSEARRKPHAKAAYEEVVAYLLGSVTSGCMSALDRALEMNDTVASLIIDFYQKEALLGYNDPPAKRDALIEKYGKCGIQCKRNYALVTTGAPVNADWETGAWRGTAGLEVETVDKKYRRAQNAALFLRKPVVRTQRSEKWTPDVDKPTENITFSLPTILSTVGMFGSGSTPPVVAPPVSSAPHALNNS